MKLSKRGLKGIGIAWCAIFIGIGIGILMISNPKVWGLFFGILGLIVATICSYGIGKIYDDIEGLKVIKKAKGRKAARQGE